MAVAIVTGSDSGIGKAAVALAHDGFDVGVTWHRDEGGARPTARETVEAGSESEVRHLDPTNVPDAADVIDELAGVLGGHRRPRQRRARGHRECRRARRDRDADA